MHCAERLGCPGICVRVRWRHSRCADCIAYQANAIEYQQAHTHTNTQNAPC